MALLSSTTTQTVVIHTIIQGDIPLQLQIPAPAVAPTPEFVTVIMTPVPPAVPVATTLVIPLVILTDAIFIIKYPAEGDIESYTVQQTVPNAEVTTQVRMAHASVGTLALTNDDSTATLALISAPLPAHTTSKGSLQGLDTSTTLTTPRITATASSKTGMLTGTVQQSTTNLGFLAAVATQSSQTKSSSAMTPLQKGETALFVLLGLVTFGVSIMIIYRVKKCRKVEEEWRESELEKRISEQQQRAEETAWNAKVTKEGVELTAEQFRDRVRAALTELECYQEANRVVARVSNSRKSKDKTETDKTTSKCHGCSH